MLCITLFITGCTNNCPNTIIESGLIYERQPNTTEIPVDTINHHFILELVRDENSPYECILFSDTITFDFYKSEMYSVEQKNQFINGFKPQVPQVTDTIEVEKYPMQWSLGRVSYSSLLADHIKLQSYLELDYFNARFNNGQLGFRTEINLALVGEGGFYLRSTTEELGGGVTSSISNGHTPLETYKITHQWWSSNDTLTGKNVSLGWDTVAIENLDFETLFDKNDSISLRLIDDMYPIEGYYFLTSE